MLQSSDSHCQSSSKDLVCKSRAFGGTASHGQVGGGGEVGSEGAARTQPWGRGASPTVLAPPAPGPLAAVIYVLNKHQCHR